MSTRRTMAALLIALSLGGCAVSVDPAPTESPGPVQSGPDPDALRNSLGEIDPGLDDAASVTDADEICASIEQNDEEAAIEEDVRGRFAARAESELSDEQVADILDAIRSQYCG